MDPTQDIAPVILERLPIDSLISLAKTTAFGVVGDTRDIWNEKLSKMGYPHVPCAQGLYFLVLTHIHARDLLPAVMSTGVIEHVVAVMKVHSLSNVDVAASVLHITQPLEGAIHSLAVAALKAHHPHKAGKYIPWSVTYNLLPEIFDKKDVGEFFKNVRPTHFKAIPTLLSTCLDLAEKFSVEPTAIILSQMGSPTYLIERPGIYMMIDVGIQVAKLTETSAEEIYPRLKTLADENPTLYGGSFYYVAYYIGDARAIDDIADFWSKHLLALFESPYFDQLYSNLGYLRDDEQQPYIIKSIKEAAIAKGVLYELIIKLLNVVGVVGSYLFMWFFEDVDVVILPEHYAEFLTAVSGNGLLGELVDSSHHSGIPKEVIDEYASK